MGTPGDFIWLFGENLGETANNNSYYFWDHVIDRDDGIRKYLVLARNHRTLALVAGMDPRRRQFVVWRNSLKHLRLYLDADMFFVTLSYRDVRPERLGYRKLEFKTQRPVVYLQHGTLAIKRIDYNEHSYNNNMYRFVYYNPLIRDVLVEQKQFKPYQLYHGEFHPRYKELVRRARLRDQHGSPGRQILWFLTWREYFGKNSLATDRLMRNIRSVVTSRDLRSYLESNEITLKVCVHPFFNADRIASIVGGEDCSRIEFVHPDETDLMGDLVESELLITDYSSVGFDFSLLGKPTILYQPDRESYLYHRRLYCTVEELAEQSISKSRDLVATIVNGTYGINEFFSARLPESVNYDYIAEGRHIDRMYEYFSANQRERISFIGYNFFGVGGTVSATKALAEGLLEKGYMVQLISLKKNGKLVNPPAALNMQSLYVERSKRTVERLKKGLFKSERLFLDIRHDQNKRYLIPYVGFALRRMLSRTRSAVIVSTRESLHSAVCKATAPGVREKICFFHTDARILDETFPGVVGELRQLPIAKAVFVTEKSRQELIAEHHYSQYESYAVIGNALESSRMIGRDEIRAVEPKDIYRGMYLLRLSTERIDDMVNLLGFAEHLRERNLQSIVIDVYGQGDYRDEFLDLVYDRDLQDIVIYRGLTKTPCQKMREYDAIVDFSLSHSFGMAYIEGVLNGKPVYCMENPGSLEVMSEIPGCFIRSYEDLIEKMLRLPEITVEELQSNYDRIMTRYSREMVADRFLDFLDLQVVRSVDVGHSGESES